MLIVNDRALCGVRIDHDSNDFTLLGIPDAVRVYRMNGTAPVLILERTIGAPVDGDFSACDIYTATGETYEYIMKYVSGDTEVPVYGAEITVDFDGIFIGNAMGAYVCVGNPAITYQRQTSQTYVQPYFSTKPQAVRNGAMDYYSGTVKGVFTPFDAEGNPLFGRNQAYRRVFSNFLNNATIKLLKSYEGWMWLVQVDAVTSEDAQGIVEAVEQQFAWTEVADAPVTPEAVVWL